MGYAEVSLMIDEFSHDGLTSGFSNRLQRIHQAIDTLEAIERVNLASGMVIELRCYSSNVKHGIDVCNWIATFTKQATLTSSLVIV